MRFAAFAWYTTSAALGGLLVACSSGHASSAGDGDASVVGASSSTTASPDALAVLGAQPGFAAGLHPKAGFRAVDDGFTLPGSSLAIHAPTLANQPMRLSDTSTPEAWIEVTGLAVHGTGAKLHGGVLVYRGGLDDDGDVVLMATGTGVEEARVLKRPTAAYHARYAIRFGAGIASVRAREHRIECIDRTGYVRIGTAPLFAVDADGRRVELDVAVSGSGHDAVVDVTGAFDGLTAPIVVDPVWTTLSPMAVPRFFHGAVTLKDGTILVAGGQNGTGALDAAEVYDPKTNTWTTVGHLQRKRDTAALTLTASGHVMVANGSVYDMPVESYDPTTKTWTGVPIAGVGTGDVLFALPSGKVLLTGQESIAFYNETTGAWTAGKTGPAPRAQYGATLLPDGRMMIAGGFDQPGKTYAQVDIYDPVADAWTTTGPLSTRRRRLGLVTLADGSVLAVGGELASGASTTLVERWDPTSKTWSTVDPLPFNDNGGGPLVFATLPGGHVLTAGLDSTGKQAAIFDPSAAQWRIVSPTTSGHLVDPPVLPLGTGAIVFGGQDAFAATAAIEKLVPLANGATCTATTPGDCASGYCADGVCCDRACTGACEQCSATGSCAAMTGAPHPGRTCAPFLTCTAGACATSCSADGDCASGSWCTGGKCVAKTANGVACTTARSCTSGSCIDGFCCNVACGGQCEACDIGGHEGTCTAVTGTPRGGRPACTDGAAECGAVCDGKTRTACVHLPAGTTPCGKASCISGVETHPSTCDGAGACSDKASACGAYACGVDVCKTACGSKADCTAGNLCVANACVPAPGLGDPCKDPSECSTGFCVDGVCCGVSSCGAGSTCAATGKAGHCSHLLGIACTLDDQCASGKCVDGVCCDGACDGNCEACDVPGSAGKCSAVKGAPHAKRPACPSDATDACKTTLCDGVERKSCASFVGAAISCRARACVDGMLSEAASCDGKGGCPAAAPKTCGGYACDASGSECLRVCHASSECAKGYLCDKGECRPATATCSTDGSAAVAADGTTTPCGDYRCKVDHCLTTCSATDECVPGKICGGDGLCADPAPGGGGGGCSLGPSGSSRSSAALVGLLVLGAFFLRRRRALVASVLAASAVGCSSRDVTNASTEGSGSSEPAPKTTAPANGNGSGNGNATLAPMTPRDASGVIDALAALTPYGARLHGEGRLQATPHGLRYLPPTQAGPWALVPGATLLATLPSASDGATRLETSDGRFGVDVVPVAVPAARPELVGNVAVYRGVDEESDLVDVVDQRGLEELHLLRVARGRTFTRRLHLLGDAVGARVVSGRVEIFDALGVVRLHTAPIVAWDADGRERALQVELTRDGDDWVLRTTLDATGLRAPIAVDPAWSTSTDTIWGHAPANVVRTSLGTVFAVGSVSGDHRGLFDPSTGKWVDVSGLSNHMDGFVLPLASGKILVGGGGDSAGTRQNDIFDPATRFYAAGGVRTASRADSAAVFVGAPANASLVFGGYDSTPKCQPIVERYDEATSTWTTVAPMSIARCHPTATVLASGKVLVVGGFNDAVATPLASAEIYDPVANTWKTAAAPATKRLLHAAVRLSSGKVLVAGTAIGSAGSKSAEVYDPTTDTWTATPGMALARIGAFAALLPSGRVLVAGGNDTDPSTEVYDPTLNAFLPAGKMLDARLSPSGTALADGSVLVFGGTRKGETLFSSERFVEQALGGACTSDGECSSGHCADGVCCATTCTGACQSCATSGAKGTCTGITGTPLSGHATCTPYVTCSAGACASTCTTDGDCVASAFCSGGACVAKKANGTACAAARECTSSACADGVCCNVACTGQCEACAESGSVGTCAAVTGLPRATHPACDGISVGGACGTHCDGIERKTCVYPAPALTACSGDACSGGIETHASSCDGVGRCNDVPKHCGAFACGATKCKTACTATSDCVAGFVCKGTACIPAPGLGQPCSATAPCEGALFCTDGVCCGEASCGASKSCALPATKGTCAKVNAESCVSDGECGSGACVDGVCCESTCDGQCQACDVTGSVGKCTPVKGKPHGKRIACSASGDRPCESTLCDGSDGSRCAAFVGSDVACTTSKCVDGVLSDPASCVAGTCGTPVTHTCAPYRCGADAKSCLAACGRNEDCAAGYVCNAKTCVLAKRHCADDASAVIDPEGNSFACAPFLCRADDCLTECKGSDDCAPGNICDSTAHCVPPRPDVATDGGSGGCATGGGGASGGLVAWSFALSAALMGVLRRRNRG